MISRLVMFCHIVMFCLSAQAAPIATFKNLEGKSVQIESKSKYVLIYQWATWCSACKEKLESVLPDWKKNIKDVEIITLNTDSDAAKARHFVNKYALTLPVYRDEEKVWIRELKAFSCPFWAVYSKQVDGSHKLKDSAGGWDEEKVKKALDIK